MKNENMEIEKEIRFIIKTDKLDDIAEIVLKLDFPKISVLNIRDTYPDTEDFRLLKSSQGYRKREITIISVNNIPSDALVKKEFVYKKKQGEVVYEKELTETQFKKGTESLEKDIVIDKNRFVFAKDDIEIVIDVIRGIGNLLEIECSGESEPQDVFDSLGVKEGWVEKTMLGATELWLEKKKSAS